MKKNKLRAIKPLLRQVLFLKRIEAEMQAAYELISSRLVEELASHIKTVEPLAKSDEKDLNEMVRKVPRFEVDLSSISKLIEKYMLALKYTIIGKAAGKAAEDAVAELRIKTKIPAGGVVQGYLSALDAHTEYLKGVLDKEGNISSKWTKYGLDFIKEKTGMMVDSKILELRSRTLTALQDTLKDLDVQNEAAVREYVLAEQFADRNIKTIKAKQALVKEAIQDVFEKKTPIHVVKQRLKDVTKDYATNWNKIIRTETGLASGAASQQAIQDIVGHEDPVVAIIVVKDDRLSEFCEKSSLNEAKEYKYFKMSTIKPPGFNLGKKKGEWKNSTPPRHFNCFVEGTRILTEKGWESIETLNTAILTDTGVESSTPVSVLTDGRWYISQSTTDKASPLFNNRRDDSPQPILSTGAYFTGMRDVIKITSQCGHELVVTEDHDVLVLQGQNGKKIPAVQVLPGMQIPVFAKRAFYKGENWPDVAELLGHVMGDGGLRVNSDGDFEAKLIFHGDDISYGRSLYPKFVKIIQTHSVRKGHKAVELKEYLQKGSSVPYIATHSTTLGGLAIKYGCQPKKLIGPHIPLELWKADEVTICAFLRGLFCADGSVSAKGPIVISLVSNSTPLLRDVQILLSGLGITSRIYNKDEKVTKHVQGKIATFRPTYRLHIQGFESTNNFANLVGFGAHPKHKKLVDQLKSDTTRRSSISAKVRHVEKIGQMPTWGVTEPKYNSVIANGIVTGNCRCSLVYIPDGFRLDQYGSLIALKEGDTLTLES